MLYNYIENKQIKKENENIQYFKQIRPFTFGIIFDGLVSIEIRGNSAIFYSKKTKNCLGVSNVLTLDLFEVV